MSDIQIPNENSENPLAARAMYYEKRSAELIKVATAMREWIDAVPTSVPLPTMPGFDRDWADAVIADSFPPINNMTIENQTGATCLAPEVENVGGSLALDRSVLYAAMTTGNWRFTKSMPASYFSDEYNTELVDEWQVERLSPPYCLNKGDSRRMWTGTGPASAVLNAVTALAKEGFQLEPEVAACFAGGSGQLMDAGSSNTNTTPEIDEADAALARMLGKESTRWG